MRSLEPAVPLAGGSASCCLSFADVEAFGLGPVNVSADDAVKGAVDHGSDFDELRSVG